MLEELMCLVVKHLSVMNPHTKSSDSKMKQSIKDRKLVK